MIRRYLCSGIVGSQLFVTGAAFAQPSYCPSGSPSPCGQAQIGDILVTLAGMPARVIGLNPNTREYYVFSNVNLAQELGDIAVLPNNPVESVVIGIVDNSFIGVRKLDACGNASEAYGTFPATWPLPFVPYPKGGTSNRGLVFSPLNKELFSPGLPQPFFNQDPNVKYEPLFKFGSSGGSASVLPISGSIVDAVRRGAIAADEVGNLYIGESDTHNLTKVPAFGVLTSAPVAVGIGSPWFHRIHDAVHDGNNHIFVTDFTFANNGRLQRFNIAPGGTQVWADNRGAFGGDSLNELTGIAIDASGDLWVAEHYHFGTERGGLLKISGRDGGVIDYFQMPEQIEGQAAAGALPTGVAIYGVNTPVVRERCASSCTDGQISDCYGGCLPADFMGNGVCDAGPSVSLNCYAREFDGSDCSVCASDEFPDCNGHCGPKGWIGDGICDDGGWLYNGNWINFDCPEFRYDEATCRGCNADEAMDCNGNCAPSAWYGDQVCDDGSYEWLGEWIDFNCPEYDFDQHVCQ